MSSFPGIEKGTRSTGLTKYRWNNGYFVERSYPTLEGRFRRLAVPNDPVGQYISENKRVVTTSDGPVRTRRPASPPSTGTPVDCGGGARPLCLRTRIGRRLPPSHPLRVGRRWDIRTPPNTPTWPGQGSAGPPAPPSEPLLAARGDIGVLQCDCIDTHRPPKGTYGCCRAACEIGGRTNGQKGS